jgi:ADP-heptose:LPS heptosyltransferase
LSEDLEQVYDFIFDCTDYVFDEQNVYYTHESTIEEFKQFLESLTQEQFDRILDFFKDLPTIKKELKHKCEKCEFEHNLVLEGLYDFFT